MPTSATGTWTDAPDRSAHTPRLIARLPRRRRRRTPGFTLIEILVVVVIVAIVASVAVISVNAVGRDTELADETRRLTGLIDMVREQAEMEGRDYALRLEEERYDFMLFDVRRNDWLIIDEDRFLRPRELPEGLLMEDDPAAVERRLGKPDRREEFEGARKVNGKPQDELWYEYDAKGYQIIFWRLAGEPYRIRFIKIAEPDK